MKRDIRNVEGIVLHLSEAGSGGRRAAVFTAEKGLLHLFVSRGLMARYGPGSLLPLCRVRMTAAFSEEGAVVSQYEGHPMFDVLSMTYKELQQWSYLIELVQLFFPEGEQDMTVYSILLHAAATAASKNPTVTAFTASVQVLRAAGYDPTGSDTARAMALSEEAHRFLCALACYSWTGEESMIIRANVFHEAALFIDRFLESACDVRLHTAGAFALP